MNNNEIFLEFWKNHQWPEPTTLYFRLYHDKDGNPLRYSRHHEPGEFIDVTPEEFAIGRMDIKVKDGKIIYPPPPRPMCLKVSASGAACDPYDVTVLVSGLDDKESRRWRMQ